MKAIIFDIDNTLIDFMRMKKASCDAAIEAMIDAGLKLSKKKALDELYEIYYKEGLEDRTIFQKFLKKVTGNVDYKLLAYGIVAYRQTRAGYLRSYPGAKRTLMKLRERGLKLAVVSDAPKIMAWLRLAHMQLDDFFDVVVAFDDTGRHKPSRLPFNKALKILKVKPEDCLMVGDRPNKDIKGARELGMKTAFAKYGFEGKPPRMKVDFILNKIEDLIPIIDKL